MEHPSLCARAGSFLARHRRAILLLGLALALLPILLVGLYNRQSADDYSYAILTRHAFVENGFDLPALLSAALQTTIEYFHTWQGLYVSAFVLSLQPAIFGEQYYALAAVLIVGFLALCVFFCARQAGRLLFGRSPEVTALAMVYLFYILECMTSPVQGIYWFNGAGNYVPFWGLCLATAGLLCRFCGATGRPQRLRISLLLCVIAFLTSGGNHVSALLELLVLAMGFVVLGLLRKKPRYLLPPLVVGLAGLVFNITSPGTAVRQRDFPAEYRPGLIRAVIDSLLQAVRYLPLWVGPSLVCYLLLVTPLLIRLMRRRSAPPCWLWPLCLLATMGLVAAMICVPYYAMGDFGAGRLTNIVWFTFAAGLTVSYGALLGRLIHRGCLDGLLARGKRLPAGSEVLLSGLLAGLILLFGNNSSYSTTAYALQELLNGDAALYASQLDSRKEVLYDESVQDVRMEPITVGPYLLYFSDVTEDVDNWQNVAMADYYYKQTVALTGPVVLED